MHMARAPGTFSITGTATIAGKNGTTRQQDCNAATVTHMFPDVESIIADAGVDGKMKAMWAEALSSRCSGRDAQGPYRQEVGAWILLNTQTGGYEFIDVPPGEKVYGDADTGGSIETAPRPSDTNHGSHDGGKYVVAFFHTHTPTYYFSSEKYSRAIGISKGDRNAANIWQTPFIAYDYVATDVDGTGAFAVPGKHPLNSAAKPYCTDKPKRREY
jgi:hypothetical protein